MKKLVYLFLLFIIVMVLSVKPNNLNHKQIFASKEDGIYIFEVQSGAKTFRFLTFEDNVNTFSRQGAIYTKIPEKLGCKHCKIMLYSLTFNNNPQKVLMLGMGIGTMATQIAEYFPNTIIDIVEINPKIPQVAEEYFGFIKTKNMNIFIQDGCKFVMNSQPESYDLVLIDAFDDKYIPPQFLQDKFFKKVKEITTQNGIVVFNTFSSSKTYKEEEDLVLSNFPFGVEIKDANRIIFASKSELKNHKIPQDLGKKIDFQKYSPTKLQPLN